MKKQEKYSQTLMNTYERQLLLSDRYSPYMLWKLAKSKGDIVRSDLARALVYDTESKVSLDILCKLAKDKDALVRAEAIDSLSRFCCERSYRVMKSALMDSDSYVRKYASFGLAWIGKSLSPISTGEILFEREKRENNVHGLVGIYEGLYILGYENYLNKLIDLFAVHDYQIQCSVLNSLSEIVNKENKSIIKSFVETVKKAHYPKAVEYALLNLENIVANKC